jgi:hypothetical protein
MAGPFLLFLPASPHGGDGRGRTTSAAERSPLTTLCRAGPPNDSGGTGSSKTSTLPLASRFAIRHDGREVRRVRGVAIAASDTHELAGGGATGRRVGTGRGSRSQWMRRFVAREFTEAIRQSRTSIETLDGGGASCNASDDSAYNALLVVR